MEVTRDEIKKAFQDSIERWEKIVEDVEYYKGTDCALCNLGDFYNECNKYCPIMVSPGQTVTKMSATGISVFAVESVETKTTIAAYSSEVKKYIFCAGAAVEEELGNPC